MIGKIFSRVSSIKALTLSVGARSVVASMTAKLPIHCRARTALDLDEGGAGDAESPAYDADAVAGDDRSELVVDLGFGVDALRIDDDPSDGAGARPQHLDIGTADQPADARRRQYDPQARRRLKPAAEKTGLQNGADHDNERQQYQKPDQFVGMPKPVHRVGLVGARPCSASRSHWVAA